MNTSPRVLAALLALLAIVPVALYQVRHPPSSLVLSALSVFVIVGSLYLMFSPADDAHAT